MRKFFFTKWLTTIVWFFLLWHPAQAGVDPPVIKVLDGSLGQIKVDSFVKVQDAKFYDTAAYGGLLKTPYRVESVVSFELNEGLPLHLPEGFSATVGLLITYKDVNGSISTKTPQLTVGYSPTGVYSHRATFVQTGYYEVTVKVTSVSSAAGWNVWKALKIVNQLQSYPEYKFTYTGNSVAQVSDSAAWTAGTDKDELPVWWTPSIGADEYDLEWAYVDSAALAAQRYGPDPDNPNPALIFDHNASRVSVTGTAWRIPLIYDSKGHLFYRVRAVQRQNNGGRYEAVWTTAHTAGHGRFDFNGHERTFNWQATTTFAEEGKRKSVVQYYDGSLRGRQTVTKDNSTNRTIVAESFYDYQGRPVIQVLPAPTLNTIIGYTQHFNRGINAAEYDKKEFDSLADPAQYCAAQAAPMDSISGASQYYSSLSPFKDSGVHKYVPGAGGYPFTEVAYTQDNTGRISRQGGVGKDFTLGSGHETRYFYSTPDQRELDALFGTEVGDRSHYFKNIVRDANGQYSISYVDMHGRTIATALAGNPDSTLQKLSSNVPATRTETLADARSAVIKDLVMESKKGLAVTTAGTHTFTYALSPLLLKQEGCNMDSVCYDCLYDLQITITDDCNNQKLGGQAFDTVVRNFSLNAIDTICNNGTGFSFTFSKWLPEGSYEVTKKLVVSRYALDYYRDSIFMVANRCKNLNDFIAEQRAILAQVADCTPVYEPEESEAASIRKTMLMDMMPSSGQYANIDQVEDRYSIFFSHVDSSGDNRIRDTLPGYTLVTDYRDADGNPELVFDEGAGKLVPPQKLSPELFAQRFKPSWAEALLPRHPEYNKLVRYEMLNASHEWDRKFEAVDSYAAAKEKGYLNPTSQTGSVETYFGRNTSGTDSLFGFYSTLSDSLNQYRRIRLNQGAPEQILSLWSVATITVMCPGETDNPGCINGYATNASAFNAATMCTAEQDMAWRIFRQLYLSVKRSFVNRWVKTGCTDCMTAAQIMATGHSPHFSDAYEMRDLQPMPEKPTSQAEAEGIVQKYYSDNCKAYATQWIKDLAPCVQYDAASLNNVIIPALVNICIEGSDLSHPYGSSSVKPSSTNTTNFRSFEAYLKYYNATHGITDALNCNAYSITAPKPYDQQAMHSNKPLYSKPDSCECSNIARLYVKYKTKRSRYGSFSNYMREVYQTEVADSVLTTLLSLCGNADFPAADCDFVSNALYLPPVFQCYTNDVCVDCSKMAQLNNEFRQLFPTAKPVIADTLITDTVQRRWNEVYEQFMNHRLGFAKTAGEYLLFKAQCNGEVYNEVCDSLQDILTGYKEMRQQQYGVRFEIETEGEVFHTNKYALIQNGGFQLPDTARRPGGSGNMGYFMNAGGFCSSGGYTNEVKYRYLGTGGGYYANLGEVGYDVFLMKTANGWGPAGIYVVGFTDQANNISQGYVHGGNGFIAVQASTDTNELNPHIIKSKLTPSHYLLYFDGVLVLDIPRNPAWPFLNFSQGGFGATGRYLSIDWWKVYDANGQVRYFEDFLDPDNTAFFDPAYVCPSGTVPDCQSSFVTYFNQRTGGSYTYNQIDSLYQQSCNKPLVLPGCGSAGGNSDTLTSWLNDYKRYGGIPHLDASGADTTNWKVDFGGTYYTAGVPLGGVIKNGVLKLPDYYTDTLPDTPPHHGVDFDRVKDTICLDPAGFTFETRLRLPDNQVIPNFYNDSWWITLYSDPATSGSLLVSLKLTPNKGAAICTHNSDPNKICIEENVPHLPMDVWRRIRLQFKGRQFSFYIDSMLVGTRTLDAPMTKIYWWTLRQFAQKGEIDYIRIYDTAGNYLYNEEFEDPLSLAIMDRSLKCGGCAADFGKYFNRRNGSNLSYNAIASLYAQRGITMDPCGNPDLTLCGRAQPVFPSRLLDAIDNCSDSTFFIQSKAQDLHRRYVDSLKGRFDNNYLAKCMQAYKYEKFTVRHGVSEYHYTLYYYDQGGNLVKTIPPAGVRPNYDSVWLDSVRDARLARQVKTPAHELPTQYRYNTLNQVTAQKSPDGGKTDFWYDRLGRLALSRNARQLAASSPPSGGAGGGYFSYTKYDVLGRIAEVGQVRDTFTHVINDTFTRNEPLLTNWHDKLLNYRGQVTNTVYDIAYDGFTGVDPTLVVAQQHVRNRVSFVTYTDTPGLSSSWNHGSFYSYDIHGNVDTLLQDYGQSATRPNIMNKNGNRWKRFVYEYDLISGKVNTVKYQPGYSDQWTHRYYYDAENRLTEVQTSTDGFTWERDAKYEYYLHGPLARTVIGEQQVQGIDFAYTLQGWLKGVNSTGATALYDIGSDGKVGSLNQYVGRDALGFNLNYFHGDYQPVNPGVASTFPSYRIPGSGLPDSVYRPLYNGNISSMATHLRMFDAQWHVPILYNYKYDQLNRLVRQDAFFNFNAGTNSYSTDWGVDKTFHEQVSYDANGNIQSFVRHAIGRNGALMDDLSYKYYPGTNKLRQVTDQVSDNAYGSSAQSIQDLDNQPDTSNYVYDGIGNLVQDKQESITSIKWNVYGKITEINRTATTNNNVTRVAYNYDAQGNRIGKVVDRNTGARNYTWYVRDAQGNLMSTYTSVDNNMRPPNHLDSLPLVQADRQMYGSSRLGVNPSDNSMDGGPVSSQYYQGSTFSRGWRQYELTNHLGNVLTTVSDRKIGVYSNGSLTLPNDSVYAVVDYYEPHMISATDYYSFGMPSRQISNINGKENYRYGFNGKENDNEVKNFGNQQDYGMRIYDPRVGRFLSVDPLTADYPSWSPYPFAMNRPIDGIDLDGLEWMPTKDKNENVTGYKWVGYNNDGTPKAGSKDGGVVSKGGYLFTYLSNSKEQTGKILISSYERTENTSWWKDKSRLYDYEINIKQENGLYINTARTSAKVWDGNVASEEQPISWIKPSSNERINYDDDLFYRARRAFGLAAPPTAIESDGLGPVDFLIGIGELKLGKGVRTLLNGGLNFAEYKLARGGGGLINEIELFAPHPYFGKKFPNMIEYDHRFITQAMQRRFNLPNWLVNNRINVVKTTTLKHALRDLHRYRFLPREIKLRLGPGGDLR